MYNFLCDKDTFFGVCILSFSHVKFLMIVEHAKFSTRRDLDFFFFFFFFILSDGNEYNNKRGKRVIRNKKIKSLRILLEL